MGLPDPAGMLSVVLMGWLAVAQYLGAANADEIVFTRGTTEAINLVAQAWGGKFIKAGDVILLTQMEHHSNLVPWQLLAERVGAQLRFALG